ncbi:MAG: Ig-like domain-containing protein, partial [Deltaproteobacteria bacterium]|nr:Ig-like domain-containing protein [Deltaproteobacteria bacterium]
MKAHFKTIIAVVFSLFVVAGGIYWLTQKKAVPIKGTLEVLTTTPKGEQISIFTDGITVMFNHPMVPLTTLDVGRDKKIPLKITPTVEGKFTWLGTHGFIFRPNKPLEPATPYHVSIPAGLVSVDGYRLDKATDWDFFTVTPWVNSVSPGDKETLLPSQGGNATGAGFFVQFNLSMNRGEVEKRIRVTEGNRSIKARKDFIWMEDDHRLFVRFKDGLPWGSKITVEIPAGLHAKKGKLGLKEAVTANYEIPPETFGLSKAVINRGGTEIPVSPDKENSASVGDTVCYYFTQAIEKKSFEKAFHVEAPSPYIYFVDWVSYPVMRESGKTDTIEGYKTACASFLDDYNTAYKAGIKTKELHALSGARWEGKIADYAFRTDHAEPALNSNLGKSILSLEAPMKIPYRGVNLKGAVLNLYRLNDKSEFAEGVFDRNLVPRGHTDKYGNFIFDEPAYSETITGNYAVPMDLKMMAIDQERLPPLVTQEIPLKMTDDRSQPFTVDLKTLPDDYAVSSGFYLLEVMGASSIRGKQAPRPVYSMVQVTKVALALKREAEHVLVWATDIESGKSLSSLSVKVTLRDRDDKEILSEVLTTNKDGVAIHKGVWNGALKEDDDIYGMSFCAEVLTEGKESWSCEGDHMISSYRDILEKPPFYYSYLYTDRPIYRPGQTVYFSSFIREVKEGRYFLPDEKLKADILVRDASGQTIHETKDLTVEPGGVIKGSFQLSDAEDIPRGDYSLILDVGSKEVITQTFSKIFVVASYRKPTFKVDLETQKDQIISRDKMELTVKGAYFFGAPMRKAKAKWSIMTSSYVFSPEGFEAFSFIDDDLLNRRFSIEEGAPYDDPDAYQYYTDAEYDVVAEYPISEDSGQEDDPRGGSLARTARRFFRDMANKEIRGNKDTLNDQGAMVIHYKPDLAKYPVSQRLSVEATVQDPSYQEVSAQEDVIVHKGSFYLGVAPEKWVYGEKEKAKIIIASVDTKGKPAPGKKFTAELLRREYKFIERRNAQGYWDFVYEHEDKKIKTIGFKTGADGSSDIKFEIPEAGTYRIVAVGTDEKGNVLRSAVEVYAWGKGYVPWRLDQPEKLELVPDKKAYKTGETAHVLVKSMVPATKALMTIERGRMLEYKVIDLGDSNAGAIEIPITEGMIPNFYVSVVAHVGRDDKRSPGPGRPPLLFYGQTELFVEPEQKRMTVEITTDRKGEGENPPIYRPGDEVTVTLQTKNSSGKPEKAHVMVTVADESVFRLLNYQLPDLVKKFYYRRPDNVVTSSSMLSLKAGDGGKADKKRRIFKDTAHFEGHVVTDENGRAEFRFKLPDDLTTWIIEALALAISESKTLAEFEKEVEDEKGVEGQSALGANLALTDNTFVGGARASIMTTLPLLIRPALPRFAVWGDEVKGRVIATNRNPQNVEGTLKISLTGNALLKEGKTELTTPISIAGNGESPYPVEFKIADEPGSAGRAGAVVFSAEARDKKGEILDGFEVTLPTQDRYAPEVVATAGQTTDEALEKIDIPPSITTNKGGLSVAFKASLGTAIAAPLKELIDFPYNCSEQKSATLLALLMAHHFTKHYGEKYFDALAPIPPAEMKKLSGLSDKLKWLETKINGLMGELHAKFMYYGGGIKYWPEDTKPGYFPSVQTLWAYTLAVEMGFSPDEADRASLSKFIANELQTDPNLSDDAKAFGLWGLSLNYAWDSATADGLIGRVRDLSITGLSYLLMGLANQPATGETPEQVMKIADRIRSLAVHEPRHTSWPRSNFFWSSSQKNTAMAAMALLSENPADPFVPKALAYLLNRKKTREFTVTQDNLYLTYLAYQYSQIREEEKTDFKGLLTLGGRSPAGGQTVTEKKFSKENLLDVHSAEMKMTEIKKLPMPADLIVSKKGDGTLYYDLLLKYYLPPDETPTREEGLIVSREYDAPDDIGEKRQLTQFKVGETYKGHITLVASQDLAYVVIEDLLPAGFEPIDMTL